MSGTYMKWYATLPRGHGHVGINPASGEAPVPPPSMEPSEHTPVRPTKYRGSRRKSAAKELARAQTDMEGLW